MKSKIIATGTLSLLLVLGLAGCSDLSPTKTEAEALKGVEVNKKLPLVYFENVANYKYSQTDSSLQIGYMDKEKEKEISIKLDYQGELDRDFQVKEHIITDQSVDPYVVFTKKENMMLVDVYRQPYSRYIQSNVEGVVKDKEELGESNDQ